MSFKEMMMANSIQLDALAQLRIVNRGVKSEKGSSYQSMGW